ncbi:hypothetical protein N9L92_04785 [Saprospiraceae bacterium]|nr:hypothetical protein [Saprospiraceae bacterium]
MKQDKINSRVDRGWSEMHSTLDVKMPQEKKKRRGIFWLMFGFGFLIVALAALMYNNVTVDNTQVDKMEIAQANKTPIDKKTLNKNLHNHTSNNSEVSKGIENKIKQQIINSETVSNYNNKSTTVDGASINSLSKQKSTTNSPLYPSASNSLKVNKASQPKLIQDISVSLKDKNITIVNPTKTIINSSEIGTDKLLKSEFTRSKLEYISLLASRPFHLQSDNEFTINGPETYASVVDIKTKSSKGLVEAGGFVSLGADYFHSIPTLGTSLSAGIQLSKNKFSLSPTISYTITEISSDNLNVFDLSSSRSMNESILVDMMDMGQNVTNPNGFNLTELTNVTSDEQADNSLVYISLGLDMRYEVSHAINLIGGIGREFHFGNQTLIPLSVTAGSPPTFSGQEPITLAHQDTYYLNTGIAYKLNNKFSLEARYRYATRSLINIPDYSMRSSKASLNLRYNI